ncbi:AzlC family ABC transporter permease [Marichromatium sp. AB31]|uniref:AzlC family ABC transporter permease n=1 Tax=Marichromatium sp. AB31 TaxID=2483362 RepID=UPI000F3D26F3|nr:AzlC family ABC transporter permease [Marichromatium sp. AB31]RNE91629.1 branched-chain amino acid ABC transporter permease [Marichromatium sp. AB31]
MNAAPLPHPGRRLARGAVAIAPLCLAVVPWGLLAGSYAVGSGLSPLEGQALSLILFAGAVQLVVIGMAQDGASLAAMLLATAFITARHLLYGLSLRDRVGTLPLRWRLPLGFLLTDELFAVCTRHDAPAFDRWYMLGAGLVFYLVWNLATLVGVVMGETLPGIEGLGLEFAVAATFIAIVVPNLVDRPLWVAALSALVVAVLAAHLGIPGGLVLAALAGMGAGYVTEQVAP